jgi:CRISPR-associated protein Cmr6
VVFLDAYPLPGQAGLAVDMANNIWSWNDSTLDLDYNSNPNPFLSLQQPTFLIGLRLASTCNDPQVLEQVKQWLIAGLQQGIGSQVNAGYGELEIAGAKPSDTPLFQVAFALEGQLIHGRQKFTQWRWNDKRGEWQMRGQPDPEVRSVAFKSMLRYWLRTLALGVLSPSEVRQLEAQLFGSITPKKHGWLRVKISQGKLIQREPLPNYKGKNDRYGEQEGILTLTCSSEAPDNSRAVLKQFCKSLTWMMFHLGGIGQGARRPCYSRKSREYAPWYRGSTLIPDSEDDLWALPPSVKGFRKKFQHHLHSFYEAIARLCPDKTINPNQPRQAVEVRRNKWAEAVDCNCQIVVCSGEEESDKPYALAVLHDPDLKVQNRRGQEDYDGNLCGQVRDGVKFSPVWIAKFGDYQVVTVFGVNVNPRRQYLQFLRENAEDFAQIFPLN